MTTSLKTSIAQQRQRAFVGRANEREKLRLWLKSNPAPTKFVSITGLGGIGKSTFLDVALTDAETESANTAWIDARACHGGPEGIMQCLPGSFVEWVKNPQPGAKWVLGIDNFESFAELDGWLRHQVLAAVPASNLLILACERRFSLTEWQLDLGWTGRVEEWALDPFSDEEVEAFLGKHGIQSAWITSPTTRVPLTLAIYADLHHRDFIGADHIYQAQRVFSANLLKEILEPSWQDAIDVLCLVSQANLDFINAVSTTHLSTKDYHELAQLSFITIRAGGLRIHDVAAGELLRDFRLRNPHTFRQLRERIITKMAREWPSLASSDNQRQWAQDLVTLVGQDLATLSDYADLHEAARDLEIVPYEASDYRDAIQCLNEWPSPAMPITFAQQTALFKSVVARMPQSIRMVRGPSGQRVAVICLLPLCRETLQMIATFVPDVVAKLLTLPDVDRERGLRNDTRLVAMVGLRMHHPRWPASLLAGSVLRYTLVSSGGRRTVGMVLDPRFKLLLEKIGFVADPVPLPSHSDLLLYNLDLRFEHIPRWAAQVTGIDLGDENEMPELTGSQLRRLLTALHDVRRFHPLVEKYCPGVAPNHMKKTLMAALTSFGSHPGKTDFAHLLRQSYLDNRTETRISLADRMNVSRATYHRYLARALDEFTLYYHEIS